LKPLDICLVEPFFSGSHARWAKELKAASLHHIDLLTLSGKHWKWRMHGGAVTLAQQFLENGKRYDLILASDMLDLTSFLALTRNATSSTPVALYFHENQLAYPWSPRDTDRQKGRDLHYAFINFTSALAADKLYFNSDYNRTSFLGKLPKLLDRYPDHKNMSALASIEAKSETLSLGMDLQCLDEYKPQEASENQEPLIVWNHRWEYDKNPIGFLRIIYALAEKGFAFKLALLGESAKDEPPYFIEAKERLGDRIVQYGRAESFGDYARWLWRADISLVTSNQDFFGGSVAEAAYCDCHLVLPNRLAYPEHFDDPSLFFDTEEEALQLITQLLESESWRTKPKIVDAVKRYDWSSMAAKYDEAFSLLVAD